MTDTTKDNYCYVQYNNKNVIFNQNIVIKKKGDNKDNNDKIEELSDYLDSDRSLVIDKFNAVAGGKVDKLVKKHTKFSVHGKVTTKDFVTDVDGYKVKIVNDSESVGKKKLRSMKKRKTKKNKNGKKTKRKLISRKRRYSKKK